MTELHGNPNKKNARNETSLHLACNLSLNAPPSAQDRRLACVQLILQWKGGFETTSGTYECADLKAQDMVGIKMCFNQILYNIKVPIFSLEWKFSSSFVGWFGIEARR